MRAHDAAEWKIEQEFEIAWNPIYDAAMRTPLPAFVWTDVTGSWTDPHPGILLAWRKHPRDNRSVWQGWVISAWSGGSPAHGENIYVYQSWVDAGHMRAAEASPPRPDLSRHKSANHGRSGFAG